MLISCKLRPVAKSPPESAKEIIRLVPPPSSVISPFPSMVNDFWIHKSELIKIVVGELLQLKVIVELEEAEEIADSNAVWVHEAGVPLPTTCP